MTNTQAVELHPSLRIMSDCLDVGRIEGLLGVAHTGLRRRGETVSKRARLVALHDVWTYSFGHLPADPPGADLGLVAAFLRPRVCALRQRRQAEGCDVCLWLSYSPGASQKATLEQNRLPRASGPNYPQRHILPAD